MKKYMLPMLVLLSIAICSANIYNMYKLKHSGFVVRINNTLYYAIDSMEIASPTAYAVRHNK